MVPDPGPGPPPPHTSGPPAASARLFASPPPKRRCTQGPDPGVQSQEAPLGPTGSGHQVHTWGKAEWCSRCGRVTAATAAGRAQQWRRPCAPLPSFVSKQQRGHRLIYTGQWQCQSCPCPSDKLYRQKCGRAVEPTESFSGASLGTMPRSRGPSAPGLTAPGNLEPLAAPGMCPTRKAPLQASLSCFFGPVVKRPRPDSGSAAFLPQASARPPG